jgi:putative DNA primase/helicase
MSGSGRGGSGRATSPDLDQVRRFLTLLDEEAPAFTFQTATDAEPKPRPDPRAKILNLPPDNLKALATHNGNGAAVWVMINEGDGKGRAAANVTRVRAVFLDGDGQVALDQLVGFVLEPHVVVESSPGHYQPYWFVESLALDQFEGVQRRIAKTFGDADSIVDLSRVMRLPGLIHAKNPAKPFMSRIVHQAERLPYSAKQILEAFPPLEEGKPKARGNRGNGRADLPDPLPLDRLEELKAAHPHVFEHQYKSSSERDFALGCLACKLGWPEEDAIALIRAVRDDAKGDRPDYLWRTVQNAYPKATAVVRCAPPARPYENAKLFLQARYSHPEHPLLVYQGGEWYRWDGSCWPIFDQGQLRAELYEHFERAVYPDAKGLPAPFDPSRRKVDDLADALKSLTYIPVETPAPSWLAAVPNAPAEEIVACANDLVHVPTRTLYPHTPTYYTHHAVPFAFVPNAPEPKRWQTFLADLWGDDVETIRTLQEVFGYLVSGDTRQQKLFLIVGPKRSGKGTIARVLTAMLGRHHVAGPTLAGLGTNFGLSPMIGKPVAIISDARLSSSDNTSIVTERLLSISGEDTLTVDRKYREPWTGQLPARIVILSNELPRLADSSGALASRFVMLIMTRSFYGRENPDLTAELCTELPAIFNWALDGLEHLRERGRFQQPAASEDAIRELEDLSSPMGAFVRDRCKVGPVHEVSCDSLYQAWRQWCQDHGRDRPGTTQTFGRDLRAVLPGIKVTRPRADGDERIRMYAGIALESGNYIAPDRGPPRTTGWWQDEAVRDGPRSQPMYPPLSETPDCEAQKRCAHCGGWIVAHYGAFSVAASGEHLHNHCVDAWSRKHEPNTH